MSRLLLATGASVLAIASPVFADKGGNGGGHGGGGGGQQMKADHGANQGGGQSMKTDRGNGGGGHEMKMRGNGGQDMRQAGNDGRGAIKMRGNDRQEMASGGRGNDRVRVAEERHGAIKVDGRSDSARIVSRNFNDRIGGLAYGCPPGLDKKDNGCLPPGQAQKFLGARLQSNYANSLLPFQYRSWYRDDGDHYYRSGDGFIYRVSRTNELVDGIIPLFGGGGYYALGDQWPASYDFYNVPYQYRDYYADGGDYRYRYGDGAIYRLNSGSGVVDSIVALLAGDLGVGQQLPLGYDTYNVPFAYRDRYTDTADNWYRYNDGYIYQVDPKTRLISAVINAIV